MIALDTNVLLRYIVQDGGDQAQAANAFVERELSPASPGFVSLVVLCEMAWALGKTYRQPRSRIAGAVAALLEAPQVEVEAEPVVRAALSASAGDLADAVIHHVGQANGCVRTLTFDRKFARLAGVDLLR